MHLGDPISKGGRNVTGRCWKKTRTFFFGEKPKLKRESNEIYNCFFLTLPGVSLLCHLILDCLDFFHDLSFGFFWITTVTIRSICMGHFFSDPCHETLGKTIRTPYGVIMCHIPFAPQSWFGEQMGVFPPYVPLNQDSGRKSAITILTLTI